MPLDLPEDFEGKEKFDRFPDAAALAKSYAELEKKMGSMLPAPTSDDSKSELLKRLGAPDTPDGYVVPPDVDPNSIAGLQEFAAKARLTPEQFARLAEQMHAKAAQEYETKQQAVQRERSEVEKVYGEAFPEAKARVVKALEAMPEDERANYNPEDPAHFRLLERLGASTGAAPKVSPTGGSAPAPTADFTEVAAEARQILASEAYSDKWHAEHGRATEEYYKRAQALIAAGYEGAYDPRLQQAKAPWAT